MSDLVAAWEMDEARNWAISDHTRRYAGVVGGPVPVILGYTGLGRGISGVGRITSPFDRDFVQVFHGSFTIECALRPTDNVTGHFFDARIHGTTPVVRLYIQHDSGSGWRLAYLISIGGTAGSGSSVFATFGDQAADLNKWNTFALTSVRTGETTANAKVYWNAEVHTIDNTYTPRPNLDYVRREIVLGNNDAYNSPYPGGICNFRIWSRALAAGELWQPLTEPITPRFTTIMRPHRFHPKTLNRKVTAPAPIGTASLGITSTTALSPTMVRVVFDAIIIDTPALYNVDNYEFSPHLDVVSVTRVDDTTFDIETSEQQDVPYDLYVYRVGS